MALRFPILSKSETVTDLRIHKENSVRKLGLALFLPALAILGAAFAQHFLTLGWPQIQKVPSAVMSIDSYIVNVLTAVLCFFSGVWIRRNLGLRPGAALMIIAPLVFLTVILKAMTGGSGSIAWFKPITIFMLFTAGIPLISVAIGFWRGSIANAAPIGS